MIPSTGRLRAWLYGCAVLTVLLPAPPGRAETRTVLLEDMPRQQRFHVAADGSRLYFQGQKKFLVLDAEGKLLDQFGVPQGSSPVDLLPLPDGWFISCTSYAQGHLALVRPDGTEARLLVGKGNEENKLRSDVTGWTSPRGAAVDAEKKLIFALDTTQAPAGQPSPDWSRIAVFDFDGKYVRDINRWDSKANQPDDPTRRLWYDAIALDPARQRVYVTTQPPAAAEMLVFTYDGKKETALPGRGGVAVFKDGRVAVGRADGHGIQLYSADLKPLQVIALQGLHLPTEAVTALATDSTDRLYATINDPATTFLRWPAALDKPEVVGPRFRRLDVQFPDKPTTAGQVLQIQATLTGRPEPREPDLPPAGSPPEGTSAHAAGEGNWQVLVRPADGSDLRWQPLPATRKSSTVLEVQLPPALRGLYDVAVRFGNGPMALADRTGDLAVQKNLAFLPPGVERSVSVITASGRRAFLRGEPIAFHLVRRLEPGGNAAAVPVKLTLEYEGQILAGQEVQAGADFAGEVPGSVTRRLTPGRYLLRPAATGHESYALALEIAAEEPDSPLQRILYHEFGGSPVMNLTGDLPERMAFIRQHARGAAALGFTRETDRLAQQLEKSGPIAWRRDQAPVPLASPAFAPPEYYQLPGQGNWEAEYYLDRAVRYGLNYDTQVIPHCGGVPVEPSWFRELDPFLARLTQHFNRYPSFYGFNYNDEMFFGPQGYGNGWRPGDTEVWQKTIAECKGNRTEAERKLMRVLYHHFNTAVRQAKPDVKVTTTPMWQFPAVEGSYAPDIYEGMSESYTHWISEGYSVPWYPAHNVEFLRRPGLPVMGVFDNGYDTTASGDKYLKNAMQVLGRGVQGIGVSHTQPFKDPFNADAYRTANALARIYGPVFAEVPPANEAAVLYSYHQDVTEKRNMMGTPHWERVFELSSAGLMAGVPMGIVYEEDVAAGWLLRDGKPRVPMLFLVGQRQLLPDRVREGIEKFADAGGKVFSDAASGEQPRAQKLPLETWGLKQAWHEGYSADSWHPLFQPVLEKLATQLRTLVGDQRRFPLDSDDLWVSKNAFDGGAVRYFLLATETGPYPWDPGTVWSLGAFYNKQNSSYLPNTVTLTFPSSAGVVYDVFERTVVQPTITDSKAKLTVDLTTFPGRLYALAPTVLAAPRLSAAVADDTIHYQVQIVDDKGQPIAARVPLRLRLNNEHEPALDVYRATGPDGAFSGRTPLPATSKNWTLEVTELLGGKCSVAALPQAGALPAAFVTERPAVEAQREPQLRGLLQGAGGVVTLVSAEALTEAQRATLAAAFKRQGIELKTAALPGEPTPGVYLAAGALAGKDLSPLLVKARERGLFDLALTDNVPGPGRGLFTPLLAPRGDQEHCIALLGGDIPGLERTVTAFADWLGAAPPAAATPPAVPQLGIAGKPGESQAPLPRLSDRVGVRLSGVRVAADGKHLLVAADGYLRNLALVADSGSSAAVKRVCRVGQAPTVGSLYVSPDGKQFGASARVTDRMGQGFFLIDAASGSQQVFAGFGDMGRLNCQFGVARDGSYVIAPGPFGVVAWRHEGAEWKEAWAIDYWKEFPRLDWPVSNSAERNPQFHAVIPDGADYALVLFGERSPNGWITPAENASTVWLAAVGLADGKERWRFEVPLVKTLIFPHLHTSPDGSRVLLEAQAPGWGGPSAWHLYSIVDGKAAGSWTATAAPLDVAVADRGGQVAVALDERLLEMRRPDGTLVYNTRWDDQPVSVAFAADGQGLYVADDGGWLTRLDAAGERVWRLPLGGVCRLAVAGDTLYAAGWDGRLRSFAADGKQRWQLDLTGAMKEAEPMAMVARSAKLPEGVVLSARRPPTTSQEVPAGENLLATGKATLTLGGTPGWMSDGRLQVKAADLTNGKKDDVTTPWLDVDELFWDATAGRQVWAEVTFPQPTDVHSLTVYENPNPQHADSWPTEGLVQVWNEAQKRWDTAARSVFLSGPVNTYSLDLKGVTKLRYVPWNSYYRNFYTSEIEVR